MTLMLRKMCTFACQPSIWSFLFHYELSVNDVSKKVRTFQPCPLLGLVLFPLCGHPHLASDTAQWSGSLVLSKYAAH